MQTEQEPEIIDSDEFRRELSLACKAAGGVRQWAALHELAASTVYATLRGLAPWPKVIASMGYELTEPTYRKVAEGEIRRLLTRGERYQKRLREKQRK